jgi:hypothetical protein
MIDDELAPVFEKLGQRHLASRTIKDVLLVHLLPRQFAPLLAELISSAA